MAAEQEHAWGGEFAWNPPDETIKNANLTHFMRQNGIDTYPELMKRSVEDVAWFTEAVLKFLSIEFYKPYRQILDLSEGMAYPHWCTGGEMNIVHNCLDKYIGTPVENHTAVKWEGEDGQTLYLTYRELWERVNQAANGLRSLGLGKGDAVGLFMPMTPEIVVAFLAIAKIGGIILPLFSGYGPGAVVMRLADADAKALITVDGAYRRGKPVPMKPVADEAVAQVPSVKHVIVVNRTGLDVPMLAGRDHAWKDLVESQPRKAQTEVTSAEDIVMIIYTSGTTGKPKGAVHTHCGFPIKAAQDMAFGTDVHSDECIYWITDMGWMMGPWLVFGALLLGASFLIFDGAPDYPAPDRVWALVERHRVNQLGISPTLVRSLLQHGDEPHEKHDLSSLRLFSYTGEPCNPAPWLWLYENVSKKRSPIINYSGGTEISGGILMGNPILPVKPCAFSSPCPGMAADVFDEHGNPVVDEVGELVIKAPWIGMTRGFWRDRERYQDSYWSRFPGVWVHGDWAAVDPDGQWYIFGRSDDTIKIAGKRLGPAEVESILAAHPSVLESAAIGIPDTIKGNQLVVFVVLRTGKQPSLELNQEIKELLAHELGKSLAPKAIYFVEDLPKTRNAKLMRRMVRAAYLGLDPGDTTSLVNPGSLDDIRKTAAIG